ncbi:SDR family oxidoreductase [Thermocrispum sp.]|uniref:SDR family NAD(P)-dependent oxidoreductase n=1 Tax=Thermocrispum sp. TaxID=2060768 RepID=UPI00257B7FEE|nr:SDR family oxidoreductase [Thermocrispum sp.]
MSKPLAVVTGGSRGLGRGIVRRLAAAYRVAFTYRRDKDAAAELVSALEADGGEAFAYQADLAQAGEARRVAEEITAAHGPVTAVVGNAGAASRGLSTTDTPDVEYLRLFQLHALANVELVRALLPSLRRTKGSVVFVSSVVANLLPAGTAPYAASKAALEAIAVVMAREEREHHVRVNVVAPGLVATEMGGRLAKATVGERDLEALDRASPFGRVCRPEDVADAVAYLLSSAASYVTGHRLVVDGGGFNAPLVPDPS